MLADKMHEIYYNRVNGNLSTYWKQIDRMSRKDLLGFILYAYDDQQEKIAEIFHHFNNK